MRNRLVALLCVASLLVPSVAFADDPVKDEVMTPLSKGQPAPYAGVLLSPPAVAKIIADAQAYPKQTELERNKARDEQKAQDQKLIDDLKASMVHDASVCDAQLKSCGSQLDILNKKLAEAEKNAKDPTVWAILGAGAGMIVTTVMTVVVLSVHK